MKTFQVLESKRDYFNEDTLPDDLDKGVTEIVKFLNHAGFKTKFSCSGLLTDHCRADFEHNRQPFVSFEILEDYLIVRLQRLCEETNSEFYESDELFEFHPFIFFTTRRRNLFKNYIYPIVFAPTHSLLKELFLICTLLITNVLFLTGFYAFLMTIFLCGWCGFLVWRALGKEKNFVNKIWDRLNRQALAQFEKFLRDKFG